VDRTVTFRWRLAGLLLIALAAACARADSQGSSDRRTGATTAARIALAAPQPPDDPCHSLPLRNAAPDSGPARTEVDVLEAGFQVFSHTCVTCHQPSGRGLPGAFPPLAGSDFLMADKDRAIGVVLGGLGGPITVNDKPYAASMPSHACLSDDDVASVLTYVRNSWGNKSDPVTCNEVALRRARAAR